MPNRKPETRTRFKTSPEYNALKEEKDLFRRRIYFLAFLTSKLSDKGVDAIIVGGQAIDLYTAGTFATSDIDLLVDNKKVTEIFLNKFGFKKQANGLWFNRELVILIHVISESYNGDASRLRKIGVKKYELKVAAPEDLIANRLYSVKFWRSNPKLELEQSVALLKLFSDSIDNKYLDQVAKRDSTKDILAEARRYASKV